MKINSIPPTVRNKVAIYIRVSTVYQVDRDSLPMQRSDLIAYCKLILETENYEIFEDAGYSGKNVDRPAFQEMMKRVRDGEFTHILVWKIDRISRNLLDFANMYQELKTLGVAFVSKNEQFQTNTAMGEAMLKIILVFAELERNMTSERVTATMIDRASKGIWNGGRIPYGYGYDYEKKEFVLNEDEAPVVKLIFDLYLEHRSLVYIVKYLDGKQIRTRLGFQFSPTTLHIILRNPFYIGTYRYNHYKDTTRTKIEKDESEWILVENHHPAIIEEAQYKAVGEILDVNARMVRTPGKQCIRKNTHVFGGLMYCGLCGKPMHSTPGKKLVSGIRPSKYTCPQIRRGSTCDNAIVNDSIIGEFMINLILNILNARKSVDADTTPDQLQSMILIGSAFEDVKDIAPDGLQELMNIFRRSPSDDSIFKPRKPKKTEVAPEMKKLRAEKLKVERALDRLKNLYLYSDDSMSENEYIIEHSKLTDRLAECNEELGVLAKESFSKAISDDDFIRAASQFILSRHLQDKPYICYKKLTEVTDAAVLHDFFSGLVDSIAVSYGHVVNVIFLNGLSLTFNYKEIKLSIQ